MGFVVNRARDSQSDCLCISTGDFVREVACVRE